MKACRSFVCLQGAVGITLSGMPGLLQLATPCPHHPETPLTPIGCCECAGLALALKDRSGKPDRNKPRREARHEHEPAAKVYSDRELVHMVRSRT